MANLAVIAANAAAIAKAGGIAPLVELWGVGSDAAKEQAAKALSNLSFDDAVRQIISEEVRLQGHVKALRTGDDAAKEAAALYLFELAVNDASKAAIAAAGGIAPLEQLARDGDGKAREWASEALARIEVTSTASLALFYNVAVASAIALVLIFLLRPAALARMKRLLRR